MTRKKLSYFFIVLLFCSAFFIFVQHKKNNSLSHIQKNSSVLSKVSSVQISLSGKLPIGVVGNSLTANSLGHLYSVGGYTGSYSIPYIYAFYPNQTVEKIPLPENTHDTAAGFIASNLFVFGGGQAYPINKILQITGSNVFTDAINLSAPLSDAVALPYHNGLILLGGYNGSHFTTNVQYVHYSFGRLYFTHLFTMPVGLRYTSATISNNHLFYIGGLSKSFISSGIYEWSPGEKTSHLIGKMPFQVQKAALFTAGNNLVLVGGLNQSGSPMNGIWNFNLNSKKVSRIGTLPYPLADMGYTEYHGTGWLVGGMKSSQVSDTNLNLYKLTFSLK